MLLANQRSQAAIETISAYLAITDIQDLGEYALPQLAKGQIESAATPVEYENEAVFEIREFLTEIRSGAQVAVERGQWLVNELLNGEARFLRGLAEFGTGLALHIDGYSDDCGIKRVVLITPVERVSAEMVQNVRNYVEGLPRDTAYVDARR